MIYCNRETLMPHLSTSGLWAEMWTFNGGSPDGN